MSPLPLAPHRPSEPKGVCVPPRKPIDGWRAGEPRTSCRPAHATRDVRAGGDPGPAAAAGLSARQNPDAARRAGEAIRRGVKILGAHPEWAV